MSLPYWLILPWVLAVLCGAAMLLRDLRTATAAAILLGDWYACTSVARWTGSQFEWAWLATIDCIAALLFIFPHRRLEAVIALSLGTEVLIHIAYGVHDLTQGYTLPAAKLNWWSTFAIAWGQAILVVGSSVYGGRKRSRFDRRSVGSLSDRLEGAAYSKRHREPRG